MFSRFSIFTRLLILASILFTILAAVFILASNIFIKNSFINRSRLTVASAIQYHSRDLRPEDFSQKDPSHTSAVFNSLYEKIKSPEIIRIKVWDYSGRVIFSDDKSIIGLRFPDNDEFKEALKGEVVTEIGQKVKPENISEQGYEQLLEIYTPITFKDESVPSGVIEAYFKLDNVNERIRETHIFLSVAVFIFTLAAFGLLFIVFKLVIYKQLEQINLQSAALTATSNGVVITDIKGTIKWVNSAFTYLTGFQKEEAVGKNMSILKSGKQSPLVYKHFWDEILAGHEIRHEVTNKRKDGSLYEEEETVTPVKDAHGKITSFIAIQQDITSRKIAEAKILQTNKELEDSKKAIINIMEDLYEAKAKIEEEKVKDEAILASIGDGMIAVDQNARVIFMNEAIEKLIGWKKEEVIGKSWFEFVPMEDEKGNSIPDDKRPIQQAIDSKKITTSPNYFFISKNKTKFPVAVTATPIILNGKVIGAIGIYRDITHEKEINKAKTEFVSLASHQLRTPLATINWYLEMLLTEDKAKLSEDQKSYANEAIQASKRMVGLVDALLNVSRIEMGTFTIAPKPTLVTEVIKAVISEFNHKISDKKLEVIENYDPSVVQVLADPKLLEIVIQNLLENAINYTPENGKIKVSIAKKISDILITVEDTGIGIPENQQSMIFNKLFRADNARVNVPNDNGLGLYMTKSIIEHSGGKIWFESEEGKGTAFYVTIPLTGMKAKEGTKQLR